MLIFAVAFGLGFSIFPLIYIWMAYFLFEPIKYWAARNVSAFRRCLFVGNFWDFILEKVFGTEIDLYNLFGQSRYVHYQQSDTFAFLLRDLDLIQNICVDNFQRFHDPKNFVNGSVDPLLSKCLSNIVGDEWNLTRAALSPVFTRNRLKDMYHLMSKCCKSFVDNFSGTQQRHVKIKDLFSRFATDFIASTAFGVEIDSVKEPEHEFYVRGQKLTKISFVQALKLLIFQISPKMTKFFNLKVLPQNILNHFRTLVTVNITQRLDAIRPDLIDFLVQSQKGSLHHSPDPDPKEGFAAVMESEFGKSDVQKELHDEDIVAQALLFFFAGLDTVATASSFMAYELAVNPDIQTRLQAEIDVIKADYVDENEKVPYDILTSMKYLDQVISETLRKWPPTFQTDRRCNRNYTIRPVRPNEEPVVIQEGDMIIIPIMSIHRDQKYYPNPTLFDPERFNEENKAIIVPGSYMPFGLGPRNCIGSRFAVLEMKILFFYLLSEFHIVPTERTTITVGHDPKRFSEGGFNLGLKPRELSQAKQ